ncbi:MAG: flavin reductase [Eggerthellaceae bacterium]|nr:flavin reductase [Eggerthellaceae bacterium]
MLNTKAFRPMSYGVYIISAIDGEMKAGCVANTLVQVASSPARVSVSLNKENVTTGAVLSSGRFEASVLAESAPMELIGRFGFHSSTEKDKFAETQFAFDEAGVPYVTEHAVAHIGARVLETVDVGSHILIVGEVEEADVISQDDPMTYAYYHLVKGGKTPPKAASYEQPQADEREAQVASQPEAEQGQEKRYGWKCKICGYVVEMDELPDDFACPICGKGKDMFERVEL